MSDRQESKKIPINVNDAAQDAEDVGEATSANGESASDPPATQRTELAKLTAERNDLNDRLLRLAAEFENYKRRIRKENEDASLRALESLLKEVLPPLDNLDRALVAARGSDGSSSAALIEGVQMVQKQFFSALEKFQIKPFDPQGQPFDPQFHEAVQQLETDTVAPGNVAMVFSRGYMAGTRLLRPALVAVARAKSTADSSGAAN